MKNFFPEDYRQVVFFTGAGMSAESGVPTYRGSGGIWSSYHWQEYACAKAFAGHPRKVLEFHQKRRKAVLDCVPHGGHAVIAQWERTDSQVTVVTQNIDGMHQRAGSNRVIELHGSLWRVRCARHGIFSDFNETYANLRCPYCNAWLRPDIVWFGDCLSDENINRAFQAVCACDLFVSIGTSGVVWPAAGFPEAARSHGAFCVEINPEPTEMTPLFHAVFRKNSSLALAKHFLVRN